MKTQGHLLEKLWSIILAGGEGERVRPLIQRWLGCHKPKQYCTFVGTRSMFQHTVDRSTRLTPPARTVALAARGHRPDALAQLTRRGVGTLILQPENRDTVAGLFLPLTYVRARDPQATVVVYPSDHFVYPESRFLDSVREAILVADSLPDRLVLLGVRPDRLEFEFRVRVDPARGDLACEGIRREGADGASLPRETDRYAGGWRAQLESTVEYLCHGRQGEYPLDARDKVLP